MGWRSNKISRSKLRPGDHIYSVRKPFGYAHHGIYVGDGMVIHFSSSSKKHGDICPTCGNQSQLDGPRSSCLDCFLAGGKLYRFNYGISTFAHLIKLRGEGTTVPSDPPEEVLRRANYLLHNGFGGYNIVTNNCEHFAYYCKTGLAWRSLKGKSKQVSGVFKICLHVPLVVVWAVILHSGVFLPFLVLPLPFLNCSFLFYHKVPVEELVSQNM